MKHSVLNAWAISALFLGFSIVSSAQSTMSRAKKLNEYVLFTNEAIHGNLIVLRLLEGFNRNINKYVDLPNQQINFYGNKDLPMDVYQDDNDEFYTTSPNEWYAKLSAPTNALTKAEQDKLLALAKDMKGITVQINRLRFDIETLIGSLDLQKRENQSLVYDKLEEGVRFYKEFYKHQLALEKEIAILAPKNDYKAYTDTTKMLLTRLDDVYNQAHNILHKLYVKEGEEIPNMVKNHQAAIDKLKLLGTKRGGISKLNNSSRFPVYMANILSKSQDAVKDETAFAQSESVPDEYKMYDKYYYYYNLSTINKFNKAGPGIVFVLNQIRSLISDSLMLKFEIPHYFKVVYPEKLEKTAMLKASDPTITIVPQEVKGRSVVQANRVIKVDSAIVKFQLYDHKIIDKDIVSLSFNGDWIIEKFEISAKPREFTLDLNKNGKNYLLLHADDMGRNPPATIALSYYYSGKKETIILNSDKQRSEMIEIVLAPKK